MTVIVLATGGTIGHRSRQDGGAVMDFDPTALLSTIARPDIDVAFQTILRKASMDIGPGDWAVIATAVAEAALRRPRGIVILHGTDTLHYTAAALTFMVRDAGMPIVITGSMIPGGDAGGDAVANLRDAVAVAAKADFAEVCVVFSADDPRTRGVIIRGCRARKIRSSAIDAFASINAAPIGTIAGDTIVRSALPTRPRGSAQPRLATALDANVVLIKLTPNMTPQALARQLHGAAGAVLEGTGTGHIRTDLQPVVAQFGKPVVISTQALFDGERLGSYAVDRDILAISNIVPAGDMSSDTALVKLMWALGQGGDVRSIMQTDFAGEIAPAQTAMRRGHN